MHRKLDDRPMVGVAVDFDGTALGFGQLFTDQFLSYPVLWYLKILQSQNQFSYYDCTHRGMISVGDFYRNRVDPNYKEYVQNLNQQGHCVQLEDYRTYRAVENLGQALRQSPVAVSTSDDRVFFEEKEGKAILGSGFEKLALYEKEACPPLEEFKKMHGPLRVTPMKEINDKNSQFTSIAEHFAAANEDYLKRNPGKKLRLVALDDVEDILIDGLRHSIDSAEWPECVEFSPVYIVTFVPKLEDDDPLLHFLSLPQNSKHFASISSAEVKGAQLKSGSDSFFSTHVFQPFFVEITLSKYGDIQYGNLRTAGGLRREWESIVSSGKQEAKVPVAPAPKAKIQAPRIRESQSASHAQVQVAISSRSALLDRRSESKAGRGLELRQVTSGILRGGEAYTSGVLSLNLFSNELRTYFSKRELLRNHSDNISGDEISPLELGEGSSLSVLSSSESVSRVSSKRR